MALSRYRIGRRVWAGPRRTVRLPAGEPSAAFAVGVHGADMLDQTAILTRVRSQASVTDRYQDLHDSRASAGGSVVARQRTRGPDECRRVMLLRSGVSAANISHVADPVMFVQLKTGYDTDNGP